jgi:hypothetical protein
MNSIGSYEVMAAGTKAGGGRGSIDGERVEGVFVAIACKARAKRVGFERCEFSRTELWPRIDEATVTVRIAEHG